jgi:hypothetical protein
MIKIIANLMADKMAYTRPIQLLMATYLSQTMSKLNTAVTARTLYYSMERFLPAR